MPADHPGRDLSDEQLLALAREGRRELDRVDRDHVSGLWDGIAAAAFGEGDDAEATTPGATAAPSTAGPDAPRGSAPVDLAAERARRRPGRLTAVLAAVAAAVVVIAGATWILTRPPAAVPIASFEMDALDERVGFSVAGEVVEADGHRAVEVDLAALPPPGEDAFYELWLLDLEAGELVSLGPVDGQDTFAVPAAVDVGSYPTIDISVEPVDGDPTHSGDSVLRGPITAAGDPAG